MDTHQIVTEWGRRYHVRVSITISSMSSVNDQSVTASVVNSPEIPKPGRSPLGSSQHAEQTTTRTRHVADRKPLCIICSIFFESRLREPAGYRGIRFRWPPPLAQLTRARPARVAPYSSFWRIVFSYSGK
jgi:hypothetical protein